MNPRILALLAFAVLTSAFAAAETPRVPNFTYYHQ